MTYTIKLDLYIDEDSEELCKLEDLELILKQCLEGTCVSVSDVKLLETKE